MLLTGRESIERRRKRPSEQSIIESTGLSTRTRSVNTESSHVRSVVPGNESGTRRIEISGMHI